MMRKIFPIISIVLLVGNANGQVELNADGPGETYELIASVLAPSYNPIETPDCSHPDFGDHIDEIFDNELNDFVFRFHIHTSIDDDRCINFDRQRNEIKSYDKSPDNLLAIEGETVTYKWKFKLAEGFQSSPNFTHIHQLKSVGGSLASMPMYTLTTRKGSPDKLELRYAETSSQVTLKKTELEPFIGVWLEVTETIKYGLNGTYEISIDTVDDNVNLFNYENADIINWRPGAEFVRPKWGIYRSLNNTADLRDEVVLFANFSVEEVVTVSTEDLEVPEQEWMAIYDAGTRNLLLKGVPDRVERVQILAMDGYKVMEQINEGIQEMHVDLSGLSQGIYIVLIHGKEIQQSKKFVVTE